MDMRTTVVELIDFAFGRRNLVRGSVPGSRMDPANATALGALFAQELTDLDIANFALTLEHLEAAMYREMLATNILTGKELSYFQSFGEHEAAHVTALTDTIKAFGGTPVSAQSSYNFPAFNNRGDILNFARTAEEIGVGAYQGAAALISDVNVLNAAASIVQVEARHAAIVRMMIDPNIAVPAAFTASLTVDEVLQQVGPILG